VEEARRAFWAKIPKNIHRRRWEFQTIVLPENWTGSLDGEREETIIPSNETR
jgi:hypothetical protein